mmetsp:Transcript_15171/g.40696  ORF Transcript_15171/g.40696 Transcript_15171/m.40696 type:complete len:269 (+) Transcript_15171:62-868(+)
MVTGVGTAKRLAVVTGANKGIGFHIASQLLEANHRVILACRSEELGRAAAKALGGDCSAVVLNIASKGSVDSFVRQLAQKEQELHVLVNNAAIAFKGADPTPFHEQTRPTMETNFEGTVALTEALLPLISRAEDPRIVNVASMSGALHQLSPHLQKRFTQQSLTLADLRKLVGEFEAAVAAGNHREQGWGNSNYGMSKLAVIAYTKELASRAPNIKVNACCPGYCSTDMSSHRGPRPPEVGARTPVLLALLNEVPTGSFWQDERESIW